MQERVRMGMVGGGKGAFIGAIHRHAAALDGHIELVSAAFSSDPQRAMRDGKALLSPTGRSYASYQQMFEQEARLPAQLRMECVAIVTPNHLHYPVARMALEHGFHVFSEKPATTTLREALALRELVHDNRLHYALAHAYTGYPLVREARQRIASGEIGTVRKVIVEYPQGWLSAPEERAGNRQAAWRMDPAQAGISCCLGDIGVHAFNLAEYVAGQTVNALSADLGTLVQGRALDDDATVLLRFANGARGVLIASQICTGEENALRLRVYGDRGGLEWAQHEPNTLWLKWADQPTQMLRAAMPYLDGTTLRGFRTPAGHPEGYLEAFANLYSDFAATLRHPEQVQSSEVAIQGIDAAVRGMAFIEHAVQASRSNEKWHELPSYDDRSIP